MNAKDMKLPFKERLRQIGLFAASAAVRFVVAPAAGICLGYFLYPQRTILTYPDKFLVWQSISSLPWILKDICLYGSIWALGVGLYVCAVSFSSFFIFQVGASLNTYRRRILVLAQVSARRQVPVPPNKRLRLPITTPHNMGNDLWDEIMRHLGSRPLAKYE
jgi:hypothetical protein